MISVYSGRREISQSFQAISSVRFGEVFGIGEGLDKSGTADPAADSVTRRVQVGLPLVYLLRSVSGFATDISLLGRLADASAAAKIGAVSLRIRAARGFAPLK